MKRYHVIACKVLKGEIEHFAAQSGHAFTFDFLKQGLHNTPPLLLTELQKSVDAADALDCDAVLLGYALCSRGIEGLTAKKHPLTVFRGHDCITVLLGSKERYRQYFDAHPGTYWYSPGWIEETLQPGQDRYEQTLKEYREKFGEEDAQYLMEMEQTWFKHYSNAAYVDLGFGDNEKHKQYTRDCAAWLKWGTDFLTGDPKLLKDFLEGNWDEERFLTVRPGETIAASHDEKIIKIRKDV